MIDRSKRRATARKCGDVVVIRMTGGPDCLWLNMYLDTEAWQMICDSDIGAYAYHWGRIRNATIGFVEFCREWLSDEHWLLRKCIDERHAKKAFLKDKTRENLMEAYREWHHKPDEEEMRDLIAAMDEADNCDDMDSWLLMLLCEAQRLDVELPEDYWECAEEDYTAWQKRFAEICREVIVPELERLEEG